MVGVASAATSTPQVMLTMSRDSAWWTAAYDDSGDLDGDGRPELSYRDVFEYAGYFHADLCYGYSATTLRFEPVGLVDDPRSDPADPAFNHTCTGNATAAAWSGNFLNWATSTRLDVQRKLLYGGQRSTDTAALTVLERAHLPGDAHSFAKYYNGPDLAALTPHDTLRTDTTNGGDNDGIDDTNEGLTICNTTHAGATGTSHSVTTPPMMRVASGNFALWAANERRQCTFSDEFGSSSNSNNSARSLIFASSSDPATTAILAAPGGSRNHNVRVLVCAPVALAPQNLEGCTAYGEHRKPEGLLQRYGLDGGLLFGLVTGSYQKNLSGGVLRKRIASLSDEVNPTDGTFLPLPPAAPGIIKTLNALRIWGYGYDDGTYLGGGDGGDNCNFQLTGIPTEGTCASWGNPQSEIHLEALRYFAASTRAPTTAFNADDSSYFPALVQDPDWTPPLHAGNACTTQQIVSFSAGNASFDDNATDPVELTASSAAALTQPIGSAEGENLEGRSFLFGRAPTALDAACTSKSVDGPHGLGDVYGLCPGAPTRRGSYHLAGLAHFAHVTDLQPALPGAQTVKTFAVTLGAGTPAIEIPYGDGHVVRVLPAYRLRKGGNAVNSPLSAADGDGALVAFRIVRPHTEVSATNNATPQTGTGVFSGLYYVNWDDSAQGADYDQDLWGMIEYRLDTTLASGQLRITTTSVTESTGIAQLFGFITVGTTQDGFHAYSGIEGANYTDPSGVRGCTNCRPISGDGGSTGQFGPQSHDFTLDPAGASPLLEAPAWYAAKWGGFTDGNGSGRPDAIEEWDSLDNATGAPGADGLPDALVTAQNPAQLARALDTAFARIISDAGQLPCALDSDNDGVSNADDADDDNDGMPDTWEQQYGFDPLYAADAVGDADEDGRDNLSEFRDRTDPRVVDTVNDAMQVPALPVTGLLLTGGVLLLLARRTLGRRP